MSLAVASLMVAAVSCGNCSSKKAEKAAEEVAAAVDSTCTKACCDSAKACCGDSTACACCDSTKTAE